MWRVPPIARALAVMCFTGKDLVGVTLCTLMTVCDVLGQGTKYIHFVNCLVIVNLLVYEMGGKQHGRDVAYVAAYVG